MTPSIRLLAFIDGVSRDDIIDLCDDTVELTLIDNGSRPQLLELIGDCHGYIPTLRIPVDREVLNHAHRLRLIATPSTGTDHLDFSALAERGITVQSLKEERELLNQLTSTAELALGLMITCARHLPQCFESSRQGSWERSRLAGSQLSGKTLGIIGMGRLGSMVARYGLALGMKLIFCDPRPKSELPGIEHTSLDDLLRRADVVSLHVHLTSETRHMLGHREFALLKPGAILINTARGALIDEEALIAAMRSGRVAAAGLDVIDGEWREDLANHPLIQFSRVQPRLYITPHVGGTCPESVYLATRHVMRRAIDFLKSPAGTNGRAKQ